MKTAEECYMMARSSKEPPAAFNTESSAACTKFDAARQTTDSEGPVQQLVNGPEADMFPTNLEDESTLIPLFDRRPFTQQVVSGPEADMFRTNLADESTLIPVFDRRSFVDDICFGGEPFDKFLGTLDRLLNRFEECRISISLTKGIFVQPKVYFLSHEISNKGIQADNKKREAITKLPFPKTKKWIQSFLSQRKKISVKEATCRQQDEAKMHLR
ncbi:LOW QUALITY PROTEIN: hypothetical protein PHMEG_00016734 [Phytophthora megakarya]|uniref:Reverse transcriptase n=1 Tax=Phytophthora megakarya TaxID=4795 RepID=A0A225VY91_9STRA|nr:LOW QUALITY PROTEIN: hypothetical protein PHMEG_00016734 [Phytophthora megakarya]